jgi:hypothetical protein
MSTEDSASTPSPTPEPKKKAKKPKKPRNWRKRVILLLSIFIVAVFVIRGILPLALPTVMRKVAGIFDLDCSYDRLELNLFSGDAGIWGLQFTPKEGGNPILTADYCHGNVSVLNLFKGKLNVWRVEADGVEVNLDRNPDGHIPLRDRFVAFTGSSKPAASTPTSTPSGQLDLTSPVRVDALRLTHIHVHIHDRGVTPEVDSELAMDLRLSDLGSTTARAKFEMNLSSDPFLDTMKVTGEGKSGGKNLDVNLNVLARGVRLKPAAAYLAPFGIVPVSDGLTFRATGQIHTAAAPNNAEGFTGSIAFDHLSAAADREEALALALENLKIDVGVIDSKSIHFNSVILSGARATASRAVDGNLQLAGIEYNPALVARKPPVATEAPAPLPPFVASLLAEHWSVDEIALRNAKLSLQDQAIAPPVNLSFMVDDLSAKSIDHDPKNLETKVTLSGLLHAPGLIKEIKLAGSATPFADEKKFTGAINAIGIKPDAIKPYLDPIGIESTLKDGQFNAAVDATLSIADTITAGVKVTQCEFKDDVPLLALSAASISKATFDTKTGKINIADIELAGPGLSVLRDPSGQLAALGLRTKPPVHTNPPEMKTVPDPVSSSVMENGMKKGSGTVSSSAMAPATFASLPSITVGRFQWKDIHLNLEDQTVVPPSKISISDVGLLATDVSTDLNAKNAGHFKAFLDSPEIAKTLSVEGRLTPGADELKLDALVTGSGLDTTAFATYLKPFGIEPVLRDGCLSLHAAADVKQTADGVSASLGLDHLQFTAGSDELAGIDELQISGVSLREGIVGVDSIEIAHPRAAARRDADGALVAGGIRLLPPAPANPNAAVPVVVSTTSPTIAPTTQPASPFVVMLKKLSVTDANIDWNDLAMQPPVSTSAGATVELDNIVLGRDADPATLNLTAHATGSADSLVVTGKVSAAPTAQSAVLDITATGLRVGPLAPYLPPGIGSTLKDGQFHTNIDASVSKNPAGGIGAQLIVGALDFHDGADAPPLFSLDGVRVIVPRIDLPDHGVAVDEISVTGVQTRAERTASGELACMGLLLGEKTAAATPATMPTTAPTVAVTPAPASPPPPTTGPSVQELIAASHRVLPNITVEKLDLNVSKFTATDLARPDSAPVVVSDLHLRNVGRIDWLGKGAAGKPPTHLQFTCKASPLVERVLVDILVAPFAKQPTLAVDFSATGIHGDGLTKLVPEIQKRIDGTGMNDGTASGHLDVEAKLDRQSPIDFDVSRGFDLTFDLSKVQYRAEPGKDVLAGVDDVRSESIRIAPADSIVHFKTVEIDKPIGLITQDKQGIHLMGWVYKLPTPTTQPTVPATQSVVFTKASSTAAAPPQTVAAAPAPIARGEVRIDKLLISGLDFRVIDTTVNPPLVIPLNGLDVEVRNISSRSPYEDKPIRFSAIVNADKVKLRKHGGRPTDLEDRDLFSQITANGEVSLYPKLHGWAKTSVSSLDLAALQGPAKEFGEDLSAGVYDSTVDLRFDPSGAIAVNSKFVLTDLSLSEPPNGLIYRTLHLPAPLDVAIGAVEGADGSISLPLDVAFTPDPKHPENLPYTELGLAAAGGVSSVIVTALAAAPIKAVNDVGGIFGASTTRPAADITTTVPFAPGSASVGAAQYSAVVPLLKKLREDPSLTLTVRQQLGDGDVKLAAIRANPSAEQCKNLEQQLRSRKAELLQLRATAAGQARAQLAALGSSGSEAALNHLRAIDRELANTEQSLDQLGELLRPGADRLTERRTRTAALQLAADRLSAMQTVLTSQGIAADRVKMLSAQFNPVESLDGGQVVITEVEKK